MTEHMQHPSVSEPILAPNQFELSVPRNSQGERIGTGAIVEPLRPGLPGETVRGAILKAIFRADRSMQALHGVAEQTVNRTGLSYVTGEEQAQIEARKLQRTQVSTAEQGSDAQHTQLVEADKQQTERALDATRSALQSLAAQTESERAQPQDRNEEAKQPAESKAQVSEPETEQLFVGGKKGEGGVPITVPKNYTSEDITRAMQAAGFEGYRFSPSWTLHGLGIHGRDIWRAVKKARQASASHAPTQK